jgi:LuxR family maltose regulon positive regulatory protein
MGSTQARTAGTDARGVSVTAPRLDLPLLEPKLALPLPQPGAVVREELLARLIAAPSPVVTVVAPAGYGKSTLLGQWAGRAGRVAFVRLDRGDNDPRALLSYLAAALDRAGSLAAGLDELLASPVSALETTLLPRLTQALWASREPCLLIVDEAQTVTERAALDVLAWLITHQPPGMRIAVASRWPLHLPLARLRAEGRLLEVRAADLALTPEEVRMMAADRDMPLMAEHADAIRSATDGWPAAVYLALLAGPDRPSGAATVTVDQASLADYMREELLAPLDADQQAWLLRASALETLSGPLCDAALESTGCLARLRELERANLFLIAVDARRTTYRFHHLFAEFLRDEAAVRAPGEADGIRRRAAAWHEAHGTVEEAMAYAFEAGDLEMLARLIVRHGLRLFWSGRAATLERWSATFEADGLRDRWASVAVMFGWLDLVQGRLRSAEAWLAAAERSPDSSPMPDGSSDKGPWVAFLRAGLGRDGFMRMLDDLAIVDAGLPAGSPWRVGCLQLMSAAHRMAGDLEAAERAANAAVQLTEARAAASGLVLALGQRALLAHRRGDRAASRADVQRGLAVLASARLEDYANSALLCTVGARLALSRGERGESIRLLRGFDRLRPILTTAVPWMAVESRLEAVRVHVALGDAAAARTLLLEVTDVLRLRPHLGMLVTEASELRDAVHELHVGGSGVGTLTTAEIRVLGYLPTHLTFREIAQRLYVSPHTVKTQAISIYSKLGVSSRREAIEQAVTAGLLDPAVIRFPAADSGAG